MVLSHREHLPEESVEQVKLPAADEDDHHNRQKRQVIDEVPQLLVVLSPPLVEHLNDFHLHEQAICQCLSRARRKEYYAGLFVGIARGTLSRDAMTLVVLQLNI